MHTNGSLAGKTVIVTRPLAQAQNICALLEKYQAAVVHFPVISIAVAKNIGSAKIALQKLKAYSIVIFISANAVHYAMKLVQELNLSLKDKRLAAVGPATKTALEGYGYSVEFDPTAGFTSEALLSHEALHDIAGQKILIVRGQNGRELLRQELRRRGAEIDYAEVYQRQLPERHDALDLSKLSNRDTAILIYSAESAQNLWLLCSSDEQQWLASVTFIVGGERIAHIVNSAGFAKNPIIAENPSDEAMLNALIDWANTG